MPIKINNTYIIEKFEDLPVKDLPIGRQIMLIEQVEDRETQMMVDKTTNMTVESIEMSMVYRFTTLIVRPEIYMDNDKFKQVTEALGEDAVDNLSMDEYTALSVACTDSISYEKDDNNYIEMIKLNGKLFHLRVDEEGRFNLKKGGYRYSHDTKQSTKHQKIYERIFEWSSNWRISSGTYSEQNIFSQYLSIPFQDGEVAMVFIIDHDVHPKFRYWNTNEHVYLINKNGEVIEIMVPIKYIYNIIKQYKNSHGYKEEFEKFDKVLFAHDYDIRDFIKDGGRGLYDVKRVFITDNTEIYNALDKFYSPYFIDGEVSVYPDSVRGYTRSPRIVKDGKEIGWRAEKEYPEHYRVGTTMGEFTRYHGSGVNPETGEIVNNDKMTIEYGDDEGIIIKVEDTFARYSQQIYIKKLGFFVRADCTKDETEIKELKERRKLVEMMAESIPVNKAV